MPTIRKHGDHYNVLSRRGNRNFTHQLTSEGERFLQELAVDPSQEPTIERELFFKLHQSGFLQKVDSKPPRSSTRSSSSRSRRPRNLIDQAGI